MFGLIVAGRLVQTEVETVDPTHCVFKIPDADTVHHIVVFLTGQTPFPPDTGAAVYLNWPGSEGWTLLGVLANDKPSAVFRVSRSLRPATESGHSLFSTHVSHAQVGIAIQPTSELLRLQPPAESQASQVSTFVEFTTKMLENFSNYAASFARSQAEMTPNPNESFVPASVVSKWYDNFQRRLQTNPNFWRS